MTSYGAQHLANAFRTVRKNTIAIARDIPEDKYTFSAAPDTRTVSQLLIHIAISPAWQHELHSQRVASLEGYDFAGRFMKDKAEESVPRTNCAGGWPRAFRPERRMMDAVPRRFPAAGVAPRPHLPAATTASGRPRSGSAH